LFWISLVPFTTAWAGETHFSSIPALMYGLMLLASAIAYYILQQTIIRSQGADSLLKKAVGSDWKGKLSPAIYLSACLISCWSSETALGLYVLVALIWVIPDRRIERSLGTQV